MDRTRLILLPPVAGDPAPWLTVDADGRVLERGHIGIGDPAPIGEMRNVLVVPGSEVAVRRLALEARTDAQARTVALLSLKDQLAGEPERLNAALGRADEAPRLVAATAALTLQTWIDWSGDLGLAADVILPDSLVPTEPDEECVLHAVRFGPRVALRGRDFAASVEPDLIDLVAAGREVRWIDRAEDVERLLIAAALNPPLNLRPGPAPRAAARGDWRLPIALAAALVVSPLVIALAQGLDDAAEARRLDRETRAMAEALFPGLPPEVDPAAEAGRRAAELPPPGGPAAAAAALFGAMEAVTDADLDALVSDRAGTLRATLTYASPSDLERVKAGLAARGYGLTEESVDDSSGRIVADVIIGGAT